MTPDLRASLQAQMIRSTLLIHGNSRSQVAERAFRVFLPYCVQDGVLLNRYYQPLGVVGPNGVHWWSGQIAEPMSAPLPTVERGPRLPLADGYLYGADVGPEPWRDLASYVKQLRARGLL